MTSTKPPMTTGERELPTDAECDELIRAYWRSVPPVLPEIECMPMFESERALIRAGWQAGVAQAAAQPVARPPREPTRKMIEAAGLVTPTLRWEWTVAEYWRAMWDAAPVDVALPGQQRQNAGDTSGATSESNEVANRSTRKADHS